MRSVANLFAVVFLALLALVSAKVEASATSLDGLCTASTDFIYTSWASQFASERVHDAQLASLHEAAVRQVGEPAEVRSSRARYIDALAERDWQYFDYVGSLARALEYVEQQPSGCQLVADLRESNASTWLTTRNRDTSRRGAKFAIARIAFELEGRHWIARDQAQALLEQAAAAQEGDFAIWLGLFQYYSEANRSEDAIRAVRRAREAATSPFEHAMALFNLASAQAAIDPNNSMDSLRAAILLFLNLENSSEYPDDAAYWRAVTLERLADANGNGDAAAASRDWDEALTIWRELSMRQPGYLFAHLGLAQAAEKLATRRFAENAVTEGLAALELRQLAFTRLMQELPNAAGLLKEASKNMEMIGDVHLLLGELPAALDAYEADLAIVRRYMPLADGDPVGPLRRLWWTLTKIGDVRLSLAQPDDALSAYIEALEIARDIVARTREPTGLQVLFSNHYETDVALTEWRMAQIPRSGVTWNLVVQNLERLDSQHLLYPAERQYLEQARVNAAQAR